MRKVILFCAATLFSLLSFAQESDADIVKVGDKIHLDVDKRQVYAPAYIRL